MKRLSSDAAPAIAKYDNDLKDAYFDRFEMHYYQKGFRRLNLSRYTANLLNENR